ncbi:hypothetical protein BX600DRAFT_466956 [Xylariales sp. PMI_506]|nr:hypothetical protein BX600DRAFT_466956 [Xylariales sp. PMI_506]
MNGASELVDNTYFPLVRRHQPIHEILDRGTIAETRSTIERCLGAVCSDDLTFEVFVENALLLRTVYHARSNPDVKFDPDALMEEFLWVGHLIMTTPTPYKQLHMVPEPRIYPPHELGSGPRDGSAVEVTEEEARECYQAVESALRLSILLYAKRATPDPTDAAQSHPVLLDLMDRYLRIVQAVLQHKMSIENYIDPTTLPCDSPVAKLLRTLKPALIYLCLLGDIECDLVQRKDPDSKPSRQTFRRVLELIVGPSSAHVEALDDDDLAICTIQDLSVPNRREFIPRQALKRILAGG